MFDIETGLIIWTTVSFAILVLMMYKLALPPLLALLKEREAKIEGMINSAEENRQKSDELLSSYKHKISEASQDALKLIEQAKQDGNKLKEEIVTAAKREAQYVIEKAQGDMRIEKNKIMAEVREFTADLVVAAAGKIIKQKLDPLADRKLAEEALRQCQP
ncbi:MAG: F0F1 ATP synthase subunit B [Candidatus Margulisbacteria bacterium]|nr:F0F1 ATP synthase subunit B [Candidatus Margulisiibacteriota bacterium]